MFLRFLVKFLFLSIVLIGFVLFGAQWKLDKTLDKFSAKIKPFAELRYDRAQINLSGEVTIDAISLYSPPLNETIEIRQMKYSYGSLYTMLFSNTNLTLENLPENAHLVLNKVLIPNNLNLSKFTQSEEQSSEDILLTAYCGRIKQFDDRQLRNMGYSYFSFSTQLDYQLDKYSGSAIIKGSLDIEDFEKADFQINLGNFMAWNESLQKKAIGDPDKQVVLPNIELLDMNVKDIGYNRRKAEYCAMREGVSVENYYRRHPHVVADLLSSVGIKTSQKLLSSYTSLIRSGSNLHLYMQPKATFDMQEITYYDFAEFINQTGLQLKVNNKPINSFFENWSFKNFSMLAEREKNEYARTRRNDEPQRTYIKKSFQYIPINDVSRFVGYRAVLELRDRREYKGRITKINKRNLWIKIPQDGGHVTLPIERREIRAILVEVNVRVGSER